MINIDEKYLNELPVGAVTADVDRALCEGTRLVVTAPLSLALSEAGRPPQPARRDRAMTAARPRQVSFFMLINHSAALRPHK